MTDQEQARAIAERITAELFVNGAGQEAERLVLTDKDGRDLGGWARVVVQRRILDALTRTADTARAQGLKAAFEEAQKTTEQFAGFYYGNGQSIPTSWLLLIERLRALATSGDTPNADPR